MTLEKKIAIVTNGESGIGLALARQFIKEGAYVIISGRSEKVLSEKAKEIGALYMVADTARKTDIKSLVDKITQRFGRIDLFVSNNDVSASAGNYLSKKDLDTAWHLNVIAQMYVAKYVLPHMLMRKSGYLLNTAPVAGLMEEFYLPAYSTIKHEALSLAERIAATYKNAGIKVSVLCNGYIRTVGNDKTGLREVTAKPVKMAIRVVEALKKEQFMISL